MEKKKLVGIGKLLNNVALISPRAAGRAAFRLFCTPTRGRLRETDAEFLKTADATQTLQIDRHRIAAYEWGEAGRPLLLFVHGWESNAARWRHFIPGAVKRGWRVVAFDAPAQGASSGRQLNLFYFTKALAGVVAHFGPAEAMVGHSLGGAAVVHAMDKTAMVHPKKAVLIGTFDKTTDVFLNYQKLLNLSDRIVEELRVQTLRLAGRPVEDYSSSLVAPKMGHVRALLLHDTEDKITPAADGRRIAEAWPGAAFIETSGFGHGMQHGSVVKSVLDFLEDSRI